MTATERVLTLIREATSREAPPWTGTLIEEILARYGDAAQAVLLYGSCFRGGDDNDGIVDLYLLVDNYRNAYRRYSHAFLNKLLPPNVFFLEAPYEGSVRRAKYSIFSLRDFQRGASTRWFQSYLWSRLAQPMGLVYARNTHSEEQVYGAMANALLTFIIRVLPVLPAQFTARELWCKGFRLTYATELRAERRENLTGLFDAAPQYYEELTRTAMDITSYSVEVVGGTRVSSYRASISSIVRVSGRLTWTLRRLQGKMLSVLRLFKGLFTFTGGVDYVLWKIERHSGVTVQRDSCFRKVPIVGVIVVFWRLYRRGAFR
jgi:predicted nucleotidyltransferase